MKVVGFIDIDGIVDYRCFNFLFIILFKPLLTIFSNPTYESVERLPNEIDHFNK